MSSPQSSYDLIIIGAGISGLSLAHQSLQQGLRPLILEASEHVGGALHSAHFSTATGDFWVELGAHSCFNSYGNTLQIMESLGLLPQIEKKQTGLFRFWRDGALLSIPSQLFWPSLPLVLPKLLMNKNKKAGNTVKQYYTRIFGEKNYQRVFKHAFNAVICQPADEFPAELLFRKKPRRKDVERSFTFPAGVQSIAQAIAAQDGMRIQTQTQVASIQYAADTGFQIEDAQGQCYHSAKLALATPADVAAQLLNPAFPDIASYLQAVKLVEVSSVGVVLEKTALHLPTLAGAIAPDAEFYSVVSRDVLPDPHYRGFTFHFKGNTSEEVQMQRICQFLEIREQEILHKTMKHNRLPALRLNNQAQLAKLDELLQDLPLAVLGNYFQGVSIEDTVSRSVSEGQRLFNVAV